jgi:osmoprotectant transport system ATP-binding protein
MAADPPVLLMDEPFGALDPITRAELHREFKSLQAKMPRAVLLVTHDLSEAFALASRIAVLQSGRVIACETPDALAGVADRDVRQLLETRFG